MPEHEVLLRSLADRLDLPQPARSRVLIEVAADLADLEETYLERGESPERARAMAAERLDLSDAAIRELVRVHGSPLRRGLDRLGERGRRRGERLALAALLLFLLAGTRALVPTRGMLSDAGPGLWVIAGLLIAGVLLAAAKAYALWGRDESDPRRLRTGLDAILLLAGLLVGSGITLWWLGLWRVAREAAGAGAGPAAGAGPVVQWLTGGSALVVVSFQAAILLGLLWLMLSGRTARIERGEAEMLLVGRLGRTEGG